MDNPTTRQPEAMTQSEARLAQVHTTYEGRAKTTGKQLRAAFAHFWQFNGAQFTSLQQVTDTGIWRDALDSSTA
jgi:hypothetical protein